MSEGLLFEVPTPLGFRVRVRRYYWEQIVSIKHPVMRGLEAKVQEVLADPEEVRRSRRDPRVYLFYGLQEPGRWLCAVVKRLNEEGFLITAYPTEVIKEGEKIWKR